MSARYARPRRWRPDARGSILPLMLVCVVVLVLVGLACVDVAGAYVTRARGRGLAQVASSETSAHTLRIKTSDNPVNTLCVMVSDSLASNGFSGQFTLRVYEPTEAEMDGLGLDPDHDRLIGVSVDFGEAYEPLVKFDLMGFDAFSSAGLDGSSSWRFSGHLANMPLYYEFRDDGVTEQPAEIKGTYLDNFRNIWDLYITDSAADPTALSTATGDQSEAEFGEGKAVFYQNGTWEYAALTADKFNLNPDEIAMIPIYCGVDGEEKAGLCSGTENCWAINSQAKEEDIQASLDFLYWLVTDPDASAVLVEQLGAVPFKSCPASANKFIVDGNALLADGKYAVTWAFNYTPNVDSWRATVVTALAAYSADPTDANWEAVKTAFVDGWAIEYKTVNG